MRYITIYYDRYMYRINQHGTLWNLADPGWAKAAWGVMAPWFNGACIFVYNYEKFDPERTLQVRVSLFLLRQ